MLPSDHAHILPHLLFLDVLSSGECYRHGIMQHMTLRGCFLGMNLPLRPAQVNDSFTFMAKQFML